MELKREEIIKALECFHHRILNSKLAEKVTEGEMMAVVDALSLINELTEENERLKSVEFTCGFVKPHKVLECPIFDEIVRAEADTVREMKERFSSLLEKEYKEYTPEGADQYFKNGSYMMWSIADRVFHQIAKEMLEDRNEESNYRN